MVDLHNAYNIAALEAKNVFQDAELIGCTDITDRFAFDIGSNGRPLKGAPVITVSKDAGEIGYLDLPSEESFALLDAGVDIDITGIAFLQTN